MMNAVSEMELASAEEVGLVRKYIEQIPEKALQFGIRVLLAVVVLLVGLQLIKIIRKIIKKSLQRGNVDNSIVKFLDSFLKVLLSIVLLFTIASGFGLDAASVIALLGSAGVAIGLAIQGSLSNFAGGVLILLLKPFRVGDYIKVDLSQNEGYVMDIELFYTKLETFDKNIIIIPNGTLANSNMQNMSCNDRRIDISLSISYDSDIKQARKTILEVLSKEDRILKNETMEVVASDFLESGVELKVRCFVANQDYWPVRYKLIEAIKDALDDAHICIPYPQMDVHMK